MSNKISDLSLLINQLNHELILEDYNIGLKLTVLKGNRLLYCMRVHDSGTNQIAGFPFYYFAAQNHYVFCYFAAYLQKGFPLPNLEGVELIQPAVKFHQVCSEPLTPSPE